MILHFDVKKRENPYVMVDKDVVRDSRLSWKAKGILIYLLTRPDDWVVRREDIMKHAMDGRESIQAGMKELRDAGYAKLINQGGGMTWVIAEHPGLLNDSEEDGLGRESRSNGKSAEKVLKSRSNGKSATTDKEVVVTENKKEKEHISETPIALRTLAIEEFRDHPASEAELATLPKAVAEYTLALDLEPIDQQPSPQKEKGLRKKKECATGPMATLDEIKDHCASLGLPESEAEYLFHHWEANEWTVNGKRMKKWRSVISAWKAAGHLPHRSALSTRPNGQNGRHGANPAISGHPGDQSIPAGQPYRGSGPGGQMTNSEWDEYRRRQQKQNQ